MTTTNGTPTISPVKQIEALNQRLEKARDIYFSGKVHPIVGMEGHYAVECSRIDDGMYLVNGLCTCIDAQQRIDVHHGWCKHKLAVELFREQHNPNPETPQEPASAGFPETDQSLEDLYPKARPTTSPR
jgi:hypothetical protein